MKSLQTSTDRSCRRRCLRLASASALPELGLREGDRWRLQRGDNEGKGRESPVAMERENEQRLSKDLPTNQLKLFGSVPLRKK